MPNYKLYYVSQATFDAQLKNAKMPLQQLQIYRTLARIGKPTRGEDVIAQAVKPLDQGGENLITRQNHAVLAAWYFSEKRRPTCVTLGIPRDVEEDLEDKVARLTVELETKANELTIAEAELLKRMEEEAKAEEPGNESPEPEAETPAPEAEQPETKQLEEIVENGKVKKNKRA